MIDQDVIDEMFAKVVGLYAAKVHVPFGVLYNPVHEVISETYPPPPIPAPASAIYVPVYGEEDEDNAAEPVELITVFV